LNRFAFSSPIARKLILYVVLFSSVITLGSTALQLYLEFENDVEIIDARLDQIETSHKRSISNSLWILDNPRLQLEISDVGRLPDIEYVAVLSRGQILSFSGVRPDGRAISRSFSLTHQPKNEPIDIGRLEIFATLDGVFAKLRDRFVLILVSNGIKTFLVAVFIYLIFSYLVTRHLAALAGFARTLNLENLDLDASIPRPTQNDSSPNEIDDLADALDEMRKNVHESYSALRQSERRLQDFASAGFDWLWECDANMKFVYVSDLFGEITGLDSSEVTDRTYQSLLEELSFNNSTKTRLERDRHLAKIRNRDQFRDVRFTWAGRFGEPIHVGLTGMAWFDDDEVFAGYRGAGTNVTGELEAERIREQFVSALEKLGQGIVLWDQDDQFVLCNDYFRSSAGNRADVLKPGLKYAEWLNMVLNSGDAIEAEGREQEWLSERLEYRRNPVGAYEVFRKGSWQQIRDQRLPDGGTIQTVVDISELKSKDEQLARSHRLETIGHLTGGVAHEFNNLLMIISGNLEILGDMTDQMEMKSGATEMKQLLDRTLSATVRGSDTTRRLLAFSRQQSLEPGDIDIAILFTDLGRVLERTLGEDIMLSIQSVPDVWHCFADYGQLETAVINLVVNARDAMPTGGSISISAENCTFDQNDLENDDETTGDFVAIRVRDSGTGMDEDVVNRVFEPFYTTKEVGKGTGLGLSMVHGYASQSNGFVRIESALGEGTEITLYLPGMTAPPSRKPETEVAKKDKPATRQEIVLVVEDDDEVRRTTVDTLASLDYEVLQAADGPTAAEIIKTTPAIDIVFADIVMPGGMSGVQLVDVARQLRPGLKMLLASGYSSEMFSGESQTDHQSDVQMLQKPYSRTELAATLRKIIDEQAPR
jgi:PAS domain S-box-containing protein